MPSVYQRLFGDIIGVDEVEAHLLATLQARILEQLAVQEDRYQLPARTFPAPRSWPKVSEFDLKARDQLPAIVIESPSSSTNPVRDQNGLYRQTWPFTIHAAVRSKTETSARQLASVYLAAVVGAISQNQTLNGFAKSARWVGPDRYAAGAVTGTQGSEQGAVYSTTFEITVRNVLNDLAGPEQPLTDPYNPSPPADPFNTTAVTVTSVPLEETL